MFPLDYSVIAGSILAVLGWAGLTLRVLTIQHRRDRTRAVLASVLDSLRENNGRPPSVEDRRGRLGPLLERASRELIMRAAADHGTPDAAFHPLVAHLIERWGVDALLRDAAAHRTSRDKWRRMTALRILTRWSHPDRMALLARAVEEDDDDVAAGAFALLSASSDPRAMDILFESLASQRHPASRVASHIEHSLLPIADWLRPRLRDPNPIVRLWSATMLARYPDEPIEAELAVLTADSDPRVRKAAIQTLGVVGSQIAADCALALLDDPTAYVRAHAARALGRLGRSDLAADVTPLLGDVDWWARLGARESLAMMGPEVWPVVMRCLDDADRFVRNGAAEVIQNLGILDSLIVMEAATDSPAESKIAMLRGVASAGGVRFTDSFVERAGPIVGPRIRQLLTTIGLAHVSVC